jgi:hypothetical protein
MFLDSIVKFLGFLANLLVHKALTNKVGKTNVLHSNGNARGEMARLEFGRWLWWKTGR